MFVEQRPGDSQGSSVWLVQLVLHRLCNNEQTLFHPFSLVGCQGCCKLSFLPSSLHGRLLELGASGRPAGLCKYDGSNSAEALLADFSVAGPSLEAIQEAAPVTRNTIGNQTTSSTQRPADQPLTSLPGKKEQGQLTHSPIT